MVSITENISQDEQLIEVLTGVIGGVEQQIVDARNLHAYLESKRQFADWIKVRLAKYGFVENEDFALASQNNEARHGGHNKVEYHLTLDTAKELSMVENNEKGRAARRYFIRCEKMAFEAIKNQFMLESPTAKTHKSERTPLKDAVNLLVAKSKHLNYSQAYSLVHQRFNVKHIEEIPYDAISVAVEYVHHLIALYSAAERSQFNHSELVENLIYAALRQNIFSTHLYQAAYTFDNTIGAGLADYAFKTNMAVLKLTRAMDLRAYNGDKIISDDLKTARYIDDTELRKVHKGNCCHHANRWFHPLTEAGKLIGALNVSGGF